MTRSPLKTTASRLMLVAALAGFGLSACNKAAETNNAVQDAAQAPAPQAALPLDTGAAPPLAPAPAASALPPPARPLRYGRLARPGDSYVFAERAYGLNHAFGDAPPDYTFDYDGVRPWVWRSDAGAIRMVEQLAAGDRYYYYEPGADAPYLIRDPDYSYAYDQGELVAVYAGDGRLLDEYAAQNQADRAARYYDRGQALYDYSRRGQHLSVAQEHWRERRDEIARERRQWASDAQRQPDWRAYHEQYGDQEQSRWDDERYRRQSEAARVATALGDLAAVALFTQEAQKARNHQHDDRGLQGPQNGYGGQRRDNGQPNTGPGYTGGQQPAYQGQPNAPRPASPAVPTYSGGQRPAVQGQPNAPRPASPAVPNYSGGQQPAYQGQPSAPRPASPAVPTYSGGQRPAVQGQPNAPRPASPAVPTYSSGQRPAFQGQPNAPRPTAPAAPAVNPVQNGAVHAPAAPVRPAAPQPHMERTPAPTGFNAQPRPVVPTPPAPVHAQVAPRPAPPAAPPSRATEATTHLRAVSPPPHATAAPTAPASATPPATGTEHKRHPGEGDQKGDH